MSNTQTTLTPTVLESLCIAFTGRAEAQGMKGKARDNAALNFITGALATLEALGDKPNADRVSMWAMFMLQTRGYSAVENVVKGWQTRRDEAQAKSDAVTRGIVGDSPARLAYEQSAGIELGR